MENNVFIHPIGEDDYTVLPASVTYSASSKVADEDYDSSVTRVTNPFAWFQPFDWSGALQPLTYTYDLGNINELIIRIHDEEIKIPVTDDFINNLKQFLLGLAYTEE